MTDKTEGLMPCPHDGGEALLTTRIVESGWSTWVECQTCGSRSGRFDCATKDLRETCDDCVENWNTRHPSPAPDAVAIEARAPGLLERVREAIRAKMWERGVQLGKQELTEVAESAIAALLSAPMPDAGRE